MGKGRQKVKVTIKNEIRITGICGVLEREVTSFGTGAKVDCLKEFLGKKVYLVVLENDVRGGE